ncbi:hypothetical protein AAMO2058_000996000 [Amorphochlora amoebiformis]
MFAIMGVLYALSMNLLWPIALLTSSLLLLAFSKLYLPLPLFLKPKLPNQSPRTSPTWTSTRATALFARFLVLVNYGAIIHEGVSCWGLGVPQYAMAVILVVSSVFGLVRCVVSDPMALHGEMKGVGLIALVQCMCLMRSNGPFSIGLMWVNYTLAKMCLLVYGFLIVCHTTLMSNICVTMCKLTSYFDRKSLDANVRKIGWVLGLVLLFKGWEAVCMHWWTDTYKNDARYLPMMTLLQHDSMIHEMKAKMYFESEIAHIQHSIRNDFTLHPYFSHTKVWKGMQLQDLIVERIKTFEMSFDENGSTGYKIEKDKCKMLEFFARNHLRIPKMVGIYHDKEEILDQLERLSNSTKVEFPLFIKGCHLTQGGDKGTKPVFTQNGLGSSMKDWINRKWKQIARDDNRPWSTTMNRLLRNLKPGMAIQGPFGGLAISPNYTPLEVKVEVLWGRAYLGLFADYHDIIALRNGEFEYTNRIPGSYDFWTLKSHKGKQIMWLQNGYMDPVWKLAEDAAKAIGIEEVRIDIFINPLRPKEPEINEISLSSGHNYFFHAPYMATAWEGPLRLLSGPQNGVNSDNFWSKPKIRQTDQEVWAQVR